MSVPRSLPTPTGAWEEVPDAALNVGDLVDVLGLKRITAIRPYHGPLDCIVGLVDTDVGCGFSLERGGYTRRIAR
jgi:hypothetical protein